MSGIAKATILGRLGNDPELTTTANDTTVCNFSVATSEKRKGQEEKTNWHRCVAFNGTGKTIAKHCKKGEKIYIEGRIDYSSYEKDGVTKHSTSIIVSTFEFC
ncbi:MAG: single-stranded DNA-binding protein [Thermotogota bacterium]|nr:single-stranded DNA-binding protein [Thermotogota bacterium]